MLNAPPERRFDRCRSLAWRHGVIFAALSSVCGCRGGDRIERATVSGKVSYDGASIQSGKIRFVPMDGPVWSAPIQDGQYTTEGTKGVPVGDIRVEIQAFRTPAGFRAEDIDGDTIPLEQYLPAKYNVRSELKMTIEPGSSQIVKNFELTK